MDSRFLGFGIDAALMRTDEGWGMENRCRGQRPNRMSYQRRVVSPIIGGRAGRHRSCGWKKFPFVSCLFLVQVVLARKGQHFLDDLRRSTSWKDILSWKQLRSKWNLFFSTSFHPSRPSPLLSGTQLGADNVFDLEFSRPLPSKVISTH